MTSSYYGIEVWGSADKDKYLSRIDRFCKRAFKFGYTTKRVIVTDVIANRDYKIWKRIICNPDHSLYDLFPPKEVENHVSVVIISSSQKEKTERFRRKFMNICFF